MARFEGEPLPNKAEIIGGYFQKLPAGAEPSPNLPRTKITGIFVKPTLDSYGMGLKLLGLQGSDRQNLCLLYDDMITFRRRDDGNIQLEYGSTPPPSDQIIIFPKEEVRSSA